MAPKKSQPSLHELVAKLSVHSKNEEHDHVLDFSNKLLRQDPSDKAALRSKAIALIKLDRYSEALDIIDNEPSGYAFERAYCNYRLGKLGIAQDIVKATLATEKGPFEIRALLHLEAQVQYKLENFEEAKKSYDSLSKYKYIIDGEQHDLLVNSIAIAAQQKWWGKVSSEADFGTVVSHEHAFNLASLKIGEKNYSDALGLLQKAKALVQSLDGLSEEDLTEELASILIQAAYVHSLLGQADEAAAILLDLNRQDTLDSTFKNLIINNLLALGSVSGYDSENPHVTLRILDSAVSSNSAPSRYIRYQVRGLQRNRLVADYQAGKESAVKKGIKRHLEEFPEDENVRLFNFRPSIIDPFSNSGKYSDKNILRRALKQFHQEPKNIAVALTAIQLLVELKNIDHAAQIIERLLNSGAPRLPGLVKVAVQIFELQGRHNKIAKLLSEVAESESSGSNLIRAAAVAQIETSNGKIIEQTIELLQKSLSNDTDNLVSVSGLVTAYASNDPEQAEQLSSKLTPISSLIKDIDVDALERSGVLNV
ncbi:hypothetical protein V1514DRAFT_324812 [Lipomyces japonicus]|uniref:uncharacterized protein n=1 Tax=Lipomyces japonicus TaxID=56871 RepID=UPI0034CEBF23